MLGTVVLIGWETSWCGGSEREGKHSNGLSICTVGEGWRVLAGVGEGGRVVGPCAVEKGTAGLFGSVPARSCSGGVCR